MNPKILVIMPAEKKEALSHHIGSIPNITVADWDSINANEYKKLISFDHIIACPYFTQNFELDHVGGGSLGIVVQGSASHAFLEYLQAGRRVTFLIPTWKYILAPPSSEVLRTTTEVRSPEEWRQRPKEAWKSIILPTTLRFITECIRPGDSYYPIGKIRLKPLVFTEQGTVGLVTGRAKNLLGKYLKKHIPEDAPHEILIDYPSAAPLACFSDNKTKYAAARIFTEGGGAADLLPFHGNNISRDDVKLLIQLHSALHAPSEKGKRSPKKKPLRNSKYKYELRFKGKPEPDKKGGLTIVDLRTDGSDHIPVTPQTYAVWYILAERAKKHPVNRFLSSKEIKEQIMSYGIDALSPVGVIVNRIANTYLDKKYKEVLILPGHERKTSGYAIASFVRVKFVTA